VPAVFIGQIKMSGVKPRGHLGVSGVNMNASVSAELTVRLLSTRTGGTVWRSSSVANGTVGQVDISRRLPSVAIRVSSSPTSPVICDRPGSSSRISRGQSTIPANRQRKHGGAGNIKADDRCSNHLQSCTSHQYRSHNEDEVFYRVDHQRQVDQQQVSPALESRIPACR
jgi:hypothetical protein